MTTRGSVYHHFPGEEIAAKIETTDMWRDALTASNYTAGCPVLAAAIGSGQDEQQLASLANDIFARWRAASALADTAIAAMEGAVVPCRSTRSLQPRQGNSW